MSDKFYKNYYLIILLYILVAFTSVYIFSLFKVINVWTYTESHINYSEGLVRRGLFGTIMIASNKYLNIPIKYFFSTFFYLFTLINIFIFFALIKEYSKNFIIFTFLSLNPALILFSFYDLGGYARFEIITITTVLLHAYFVKKFNQGLLNEKKYIEKLQFIILPLIVIIIFISDTMIFLIPYHVLLSSNVFYKKNNLNKKIYLYLLLLIPTYLMITHPLTLNLSKSIFNNLNNKNNLDFWIFESIANNSIISRLQIEGGYMFTFENIIRYLSIFLIFLLPIVIFFNYLNYKKNIHLKNNLLVILSIAPIFLLFPIARDWGRWMHIIIITLFAYYSQFPLLKKTLNSNIKSNSKKIFLTIVTVIFLFLYSFFLRIPHCCNLEKLNLTIYGGAVEKIKVLYDMTFIKKIDVNQRFRNF
jgi:hypothetical protein